MSKSENMLAFETALKENKELQEKFEAAAKRMTENKEAQGNEVLIKAAAEVGFTLTLAEVERAMAESEEIGDDELAEVVGGINIFKGEWCPFSYSCFFFFRTQTCEPKTNTPNKTIGAITDAQIVPPSPNDYYSI